MEPLSYTTHKINSKWINDLNVRPEAVKFLEENIKGKLPDNELLTPKAKATKAKINKWDYIKLKSLRIANHMSDKGLICKIHKELIQLQHWKKKNITQFFNGQRIWIDIFPKKTYKWPTGTWKGAQHHRSSGKYKSKSEWDITSWILGWLLSKKTRNNEC